MFDLVCDRWTLERDGKHRLRGSVELVNVQEHEMASPVSLLNRLIAMVDSQWMRREDCAAGSTVIVYSLRMKVKAEQG